MGGRSSVSGLKVTVFGATGFVGRYLVNRLGQCGSRVVVPYRGNESDAIHLRQMGDLGQIVPLRFHLKDYSSVYNAVKDSQVVINLIAQDRKSFNFTVREVQVDGALSIASACAETPCLPKLIHVSSVMARADSACEFMRTKAEGERLLRDQHPKTVIVRPSVLFGHEDRFLNSIGLFSALPFGYPVLDHGKQVRYPLYVGDLAEGLFRLCKLDWVEGQTFDFVGPKKYTMAQVIELFSALTMRPHRIVSMPPWLLLLYSRIFPEWRRPVYTRDLISQLAEDEIPLNDHQVFADVGMERLQTMEELALNFVRGFRLRENFSDIVPPPKH